MAASAAPICTIWRSKVAQRIHLGLAIGSPIESFVLSLSGFASAKSGRIVDPVATEIAADLRAPVSVVAPL
jgi:hypothetical protein